jgi:hypothetical protein
MPTAARYLALSLFFADRSVNWRTFGPRNAPKQDWDHRQIRFRGMPDPFSDYQKRKQ